LRPGNPQDGRSRSHRAAVGATVVTMHEKHQKIDLATQDGVCPVHVFRPAGTGPWPAVLFYMDGLGIRPALFEMAERLAGHGYFVALPDLYYRSGPYAPMDARRVFADPDARKALFQDYMGKLGQTNAMRDTRAVLAFLASQPDALPTKIGATGYCMGGGLSLAAAGHFPERFAAVATYHGGHLATDAPDSPHLLAPKIQAKVYVGRASNDPTLERLEVSLTEAGVAHTIETYPAQHGWVPSDTPVHDAAAAERHWQTLFALLDGALRA
jgi:carboxymethylenebutenolidase